MKFEKIKNGVENELSFAKMMDGKQIKELRIIQQELIYSLFGLMNYNTVVKVEALNSIYKYDLVITIRKKKKYISIKKGFKNSVHTENIDDFVGFMRTNGIKEEIIEKFLYYHYGDGSKNGTGHEERDIGKYKSLHKSDIKEINAAFNTDEFIDKAIDRFFITGVDPKQHPIDAIVYGYADDFVFLTASQLYDVIKSQHKYYAENVHICQLSVQNFCCNLQNKISDEWRNHYVQIRYYDLNRDIYRYKVESNKSSIDLNQIVPKTNEDDYVKLHFN